MSPTRMSRVPEVDGSMVLDPWVISTYLDYKWDILELITH